MSKKNSINHHENYNHEGHEHHSHEKHDHHHHHGDFKKLFLISLPIGLIVMWISPITGLNIPFPFQYTFKYSDIIALVLSLILLGYSGKIFFEHAFMEFKDKKPGMMALVSLGLGISILYSLYAIIKRYITGVHQMDFLFEFASLLLIMLLGHWIEMVALTKAGDAKESLTMLLPKEANLLLEDGSVVKRGISALKIGDVIQVPAGENIAADGVIIKGESRVNEALLTGESKPVSKTVGDVVIGGSTNEFGMLELEVTKLGKESFLSQVQTLITDAENQRSRAEDAAKKVAGYLFYIAVFSAIVAFILWTIINDLETGIRFAVTTLVIACPHALGLAIPLVVSRSTSIAAKEGLLIKNREVYNLATKANVMILDKTGTLTNGDFKVLKIDVLNKDYRNEEIISLMAGIEQGSSHPIAESIISYAINKKVDPTRFDKTEVIRGKGVKGKIGRDVYELISKKAYNKELEINNTLSATISILTKNGNAIGIVYLGDEIKESSYELIKVLKGRGIKPVMATGDNEASAKLVADELKINYFANQSPEDKYNLINEYKKNGEIVIMVGDGINDAPSLKLADVGIAIGAGTQVAIDSADVILTNSLPGDIEAFINLSFSTNRKMKENLAWGAGYNFIAIPLAAGILAPIGLILSPFVGAILMSLSTVIVALNAISLRIKKSNK